MQSQLPTDTPQFRFRNRNLYAIGDANAPAGTIDYGDMDDIAGGGTLYYNGVWESSGTDPVPLHGEPTVTVNWIAFPTVGFAADASDGSVDTTDGELYFTAEALVGYGMASLSFWESGGYSLAGGGTTATSVAVSPVASATITEVDGTPITPFTVNASMSQQYDLVNDAGIAVPWGGSISIDFNQALAGEGLSYTLGVTEFDLVMNNHIVANSEGGTIAFIEKTDLYINIDTQVPEPSVIALLTTAALTLLLFVRRRR
jgi:hypothetical protein